MITFNYEELRLFYNHTIHPELLRMDVRRRKLLRLLVFSAFAILALMTVAAYLHIFVLSLFLSIPIVIYIGYLYRQIQNFQKTFKPYIVRLILDFIDNDANMGNLYYDEGKSIDFQEFKYSQIFSEDVIEYKGEDYINGVVGELAFELCELEVKSFSRVRSQIDTVFSGLFLHAEFDDFKKKHTLYTRLNEVKQKIHLIKNIEQYNPDIDANVLDEKLQELQTLILEKQGIEYDLNQLQFNPETSDDAIKIKGRILIIPRAYKNDEIRTIKRFMLSGANEVSAEHQLDAFRGIFMTFATPDAPIHTLLSEEMQNDILDYYEFTGCRMYLSVIGNDIYIAVDSPNDFLEPYIFQSNVSYDLVREFYDKIVLLLSIISDFDENN